MLNLAPGAKAIMPASFDWNGLLPMSVESVAGVRANDEMARRIGLEVRADLLARRHATPAVEGCRCRARSRKPIEKRKQSQDPRRCKKDSAVHADASFVCSP